MYPFRERVDRFGKRVDQLGERVDRLGERVDRLRERWWWLQIQRYYSITSNLRAFRLLYYKIFYD